MTKATTNRRFSSLAQLGEAFNDYRDEAIADAIREDTTAPAFAQAFGDVGALSIIEAGAVPQELDMPEPAEAQHDCRAIMVTLFDLFRDTRLETSAQAIAWGFVNSFHFEAAKLAREEDSLSLELGELVRRADPSEIYAVELEELQLRTQTKMEQRAAIECMRDYAAECYRTQTGRPWSSARGSRVSSATTASQIAAADFLKGRATAIREQRTPTGPLIVFSGGQEWHDHEQIWTKLDQIKERVPHMTLCTTAQRKGADAIATAWAASRGVPVVAFTPNSARYGKRAGFVRNDQLAALRPVEAIVCEGSGLQANLLDSLKAAGVPTHAFRHANQAPAPAQSRSMWG
ncbi:MULTISPECIES: DUF2493 domain-containing protein [unclassified Sphingomonas]|jgi:hypothetical protein|uniref:DUF2493 domain-containing protein n=1 Tax=unclassified Sphingomonas TaxID=196159 RepID=UPI0002D53EDE|nr:MULTISPECIES: DUF2493 domain-containing protein [unclassified Sphingomonas]KTF67861.1 hypothetical protein ATB93_16200 [Sphingomonas sp. WG]